MGYHAFGPDGGAAPSAGGSAILCQTGVTSTITATMTGPSLTDPYNPTHNGNYGITPGDPAILFTSLVANSVPFDGVVTDWSMSMRVNSTTAAGQYELWKFSRVDGSATITATKLGDLADWDGTQSTSFQYTFSGTLGGAAVSAGDELIVIYRPSVTASASSTYRAAFSVEKS